MNLSLLHCRLVPRCWAILTWHHEKLGFLLLWDKSNVQSLKSRHKIKWLVGALDGGGIGRWGFQSQRLRGPPYCSIWASCTSQRTGFIGSCLFYKRECESKKMCCRAGSWVLFTQVPHPVQCSQDLFLMAADFLHTAKRVTDSSGISFRWSFCPCVLYVPSFPIDMNKNENKNPIPLAESRVSGINQSPWHR